MEVVNKEWVRVYMLPAGFHANPSVEETAPTPQAFNSPLSRNSVSGGSPNALAANAPTGSNEPIYWFEIGAVDTFERSLRELEANLGVEPINRVSVNYKSQFKA